MNQDAKFRKVSLEALSSPDGLDETITVIDRKGGVALAGFLLLVVVLILWGIFGRISTKVEGRAVLLRSGGVFNVTSNAGGRITDLSIEANDIVKPGETIARIAQPKLLRDIYLSRQQNEFALKKETLKKKALLDRVKRIDVRIAQPESNLGALRKQKNQLTDQIDEIDSGTMLRRRKLSLLMDHYRMMTQIKSPYYGRVLELKVDYGAVISAGTPIVSMELMGKNIKALEGIIYLPPKSGKKVKLGMSVNISPYSISRERYGTLLGKVIYVSPYPATFDSLMRVLKNERLAKDIMKTGAPTEVIADLVPSLRTVSGYQWSSPRGPNQKIDSGTLGEAKVTVKQQPPVSLIVPFFETLMK